MVCDLRVWSGIVVMLAATVVPRSGQAQVSAELHTASKPQVVLPADGERRILPGLPPRNWIAVENRSAAPAAILFMFPRGAVERCFQYVGRSVADSAADQAPRLSADDAMTERHSCQMTYR